MSEKWKDDLSEIGARLNALLEENAKLKRHAEAMYRADDEEQLALACMAYRADFPEAP